MLYSLPLSNAVRRLLSGTVMKYPSRIDTSGKAGDADTADLFAEVPRGVDKLLWMIEAHSKPGNAKTQEHKTSNIRANDTSR